MKKNVSIGGNVDLGDAIGFAFLGLSLTDSHCPDPSCVNTASITFSENESIDNPDSGFNLTQGLFNGGPIVVENNYARGAGVGFNVPGGTQQMIGTASSSFYGNDRHRPALTISVGQLPQVSYNPGASAHCGVLNLGILAQGFEDVANPPIPAPLNANGNFWGTTHGPSATGAADAVGGKCDQRGGKTTATSFKSTGFVITTH